MNLRNEKNHLKDLFSKPFPLLNDNRSRLFLVVFCGLFSSLFMLYFNPFTMNQIKYDSAVAHYLPIWSTGILGSVLLSFSQFFLRPIFKLNSFNFGQFILWILFEFIFLSIVIYFFFGESKEPFLTEFFLIGKYTISICFLPYFLACLLIAVAKLYSKVEQKNEVDSKPKKELSIISSNQQIFTKEDGKFLFGIKPEQILYLKSENNYTSVFYVQNGNLEKKLIRTNLKGIEQTLKNPRLIRVHRSYMVNINKLEAIHRDKGNFNLQLEYLPNFRIKVSKTYKEIFEQKIESK